MKAIIINIITDKIKDNVLLKKRRESWNNTPPPSPNWEFFF